MHKLGIIVPYRDRAEQLKQFRDHLSSYLSIDYELIVVDQVDDKPFNRGKLLNIGYKKAKELDCTYIVCHDVDLLPITADYSYSDKVEHLVSKLTKVGSFTRDIFDEYTGGVTLIPCDVFEKVNGYSNDYWGWGFEDDNLLLRLERGDQQVNIKKVYQNKYSGPAVKVGPNSYIEVPNVLNNRKDFRITIEFTIDSMLNHPHQITDNQSIFSIPGFDTTLLYNSFQHFSFQFWKRNLNSLSITTPAHYPDGCYKAVIEIRNTSNSVRFFINDFFVGEQSFDNLSNLRKSKVIYLGVGDPHREEKQNWVDASIINFKIETQDEILADYSAEDGFVTDKSFKGNKATHYNTKLVERNSTDYVEVSVPFRRAGKFKPLPHDENGYKDGYWVEWSSRENQIKYYDAKYSTRSNFWYDGLSNLTYKNIDSSTEDNFHLYKVEL